MKIVADTNIYVSAIVFGGKPQAILDLAQDGEIELFISDDIVAEVARILTDKFKRTPEQLRNDLLASTRSRSAYSRPKGSMRFRMTRRTIESWNAPLRPTLTESCPATAIC